MATIKSHTDLSQSRKLAEILPIETADMRFCFSHTLGGRITGHYPMIGREPSLGTIPAWSLAALLNYLKSKNKFPEIEVLSDGCFKLTIYIWDGENSIQVSIRDTLVDACYELIIKLKELNLL